MPRSCWILLALLAASTWASHEYALAGLVEAPFDWVLAFLAGCFGAGAVGSILEAIQKRGVAAALCRADRGDPPRDGELAAARGALHPIGEALLSPLGGVLCVAYEYEMRGKTAVAAYSGHGLTPSVIRGQRGETRLCGYPDLDAIPFQKLSEDVAARERAAQYVASTSFEIMKVSDVFSALRQLYQDDDGSLRLDWKNAEPGEDVAELDLEEKVVPVGTEVGVLGLWSQRSGGLVNGWDKNVLLKLHSRDSKELSAQSLPRRLITPVVLLALVLGVLWFPYRHKQRLARAELAKQLCEAVRTRDVETVERLLAPDLANARCPDGSAPLILAATASITERLLEAGADPLAENAAGESALHRAVQAYEGEQVRLLLEAGADPNLSSRRNGMTPLWQLGDSAPELRALLLEAGAVDDRVTAATGTPLPPDGGDVIDVCRRYLEALAVGQLPALKALSTGEHQGYWGERIRPDQQRVMPAAIASFAGYSSGTEPGSTATATITGPRSDGQPHTFTFQLVRWDTGWRVHRLALGYRVDDPGGVR